MNTRAFTLALIIAVFAMFMVHTYIDDQKVAIIKKYGVETPVVVAKVDIKELDLIDDSKVMLKSVPKSFLAPTAYTTIKDVENTVATVPIKKGEQITKPRLTYPDANTGLSRQVSSGKRAVAVNITERIGVSHLIKPGDRIDVYAGLDYGDGRKDLQKVKTILEDVLVLSTGLKVTNSVPIVGMKPTQDLKLIKKMNLNIYNKYNTVTVELFPHEVQKLIYILQFSSKELYLSLRNNNDRKKLAIDVRPTSIYDVLTEKDAIEAKKFFKFKYEIKR